jgi:hypothetical protein
MPIGACRAILAIMPELIREPSRVTAAGEPPKLIDEYVGQASTRQAGLSIAHMHSPAGWAEPGQCPGVRRVHDRAARSLGGGI